MGKAKKAVKSKNLSGDKIKTFPGNFMNKKGLTVNAPGSVGSDVDPMSEGFDPTSYAIREEKAERKEEEKANDGGKGKSASKSKSKNC